MLNYVQKTLGNYCLYVRPFKQIIKYLDVFGKINTFVLYSEFRRGFYLFRLVSKFVLANEMKLHVQIFLFFKYIPLDLNFVMFKLNECRYRIAFLSVRASVVAAVLCNYYLSNVS